MPDSTLAQLYEATWIIDPPQAVIAMKPSPARVHQDIALDGSGSLSRGPGVILSYEWNSGDGEVLL